MEILYKINDILLQQDLKYNIINSTKSRLIFEHELLGVRLNLDVL
jgi:hypothetical protein